MKKYFVFAFLFSISLFCSAQRHFPCDDSRIGKLILKPLLKDGVVHYELAIKKRKA